MDLLGPYHIRHLIFMCKICAPAIYIERHLIYDACSHHSLQMFPSIHLEIDDY